MYSLNSIPINELRRDAADFQSCWHVDDRMAGGGLFQLPGGRLPRQIVAI